MQISFFTIPIKNTADAQSELNRFLGSHRVLCVDRRFVENGENSFWTLAVEYLPGTEAEQPGTRAGKSKIDYKEVLSPDDFAVFSRLREVRKALSEAEAVPVYAILTNEQLAAMAKAMPTSQAELLQIAGVGEAKAAKYGAKFLAALSGCAT